jgi:phosphoserine phosphatase
MNPPIHVARKKAQPLSYVLTLVAAREATTLTQPMIDRVREATGARRTPVILSPGEAADIPGLPTDDLTIARAAVEGAPIDVLVTRERDRKRRLLVADMDSTIVTGETLDELATFTARSMNGEIDFATALRERVAMLKGLSLSALEDTWKGVKLTEGARTLVLTMRDAGARTALVSGGFTFFTARVAALCGFSEHHANILLDDGSALTGRVAEPVLDRDAKLATMRALSKASSLRPAASLAVGDGANDLPMLKAAGLGIAFRAKPVVTAEIANRIDHADLRAVLFAQGFSARAFVS